MKKLLPVLIVCLLHNKSDAQVITACCNDTICVGQQVHLSATIDSVVGATPILILDDLYTDTIDLGFNFQFFGNTYSHCVLSTNGYISFDLSLANMFSPWEIDSAAPSPLNPLNAIYGPWQDLDPSAPPFGVMQYVTLGVAPDRKFVLNYCQVPMYQCHDSLFTGQTVLYETSNIIEIHLANKTLCLAWNDGKAIEGLQDSTGTVACIVTGRNYPSQWTAYNDAYRFTPNFNSYTISSISFNPVIITSSYLWTEEGGGFLGDTSSLNVTPTQTTNYIVTTVSSCSFYSDTITITVDSCLATAISNLPSKDYPENASIAILNELGSQVGECHYNDLYKLEESLPPGFYIVAISSNNKILERRKICLMR